MRAFDPVSQKKPNNTKTPNKQAKKNPKLNKIKHQKNAYL